MKPIVYSYNAAIHCPDCAHRDGMDAYPSPEDAEGNTVGVIFPGSDDEREILGCDTCLREYSPEWGFEYRDDSHVATAKRLGVFRA